MRPPNGGAGLIDPVPLTLPIPMKYTLTYVGVQVRDLDRSIAFYRDALGMELHGRGPIEETGGEIAELKSPDSPTTLELNWYPEGSAFFKGPYRNGDELDHLAFACDDVEAAYKELLRQGAKPGLAPFPEGGTTLAYVQDPDGIWIELFGRSASNPQP